MKKAKVKSKKDDESSTHHNVPPNGKKRKDAINLENVKLEYKDHKISPEFDFINFQTADIPSEYLSLEYQHDCKLESDIV